ncbi:MAG: hypothetical protein ACRD2I_05545 [Vicinamibacterales bacterium]
MAVGRYPMIRDERARAELEKETDELRVAPVLEHRDHPQGNELTEKIEA